MVSRPSVVDASVVDASVADASVADAAESLKKLDFVAGSLGTADDAVELEVLPAGLEN